MQSADNDVFEIVFSGEDYGGLLPPNLPAVFL